MGQLKPKNTALRVVNLSVDQLIWASKLLGHIAVESSGLQIHTQAQVEIQGLKNQNTFQPQILIK